MIDFCVHVWCGNAFLAHKIPAQHSHARSSPQEMVSALPLLLLTTGVVASPPTCQHLGTKSASGKCECYPGWRGDDCGTLDVVPGPVLAYAHSNLSSWGASVGFEPKDKLYHMFVAEVAGGCGMYTWARNEMIVHATSKSPTGPFQRQGVVGGPMWDNPQALRLPDGKWLLFHDIRGVFNTTIGNIYI